MPSKIKLDLVKLSENISNYLLTNNIDSNNLINYPLSRADDNDGSVSNRRKSKGRKTSKKFLKSQRSKRRKKKITSIIMSKKSKK